MTGTASKIYDYIKTCDIPPTVREIARALGIKSTSTVHRALLELRAAGAVTWRDGCSRTLRVV